MEYKEKLKNSNIPVAVILTETGCTYSDEGVRYVSGQVAGIRPELTGPVLVLMGEEFNDFGTLGAILDARPDTVIVVSREDCIEFKFNRQNDMSALQDILDLARQAGAPTCWHAWDESAHPNWL